MLSLVVVSMLGVDALPQLPDADLRDSIVAVETPDEPRRTAWWVQPIMMTVAPIATTAAGAGTFFGLPLGFSHDFENFQLNVEATLSVYGSGGSSFAGGYVSVGPSFHSGDKPLNGFFIGPKLAFDALHEFSRNRSSAAFMVGFDGGWQRTFGWFYLAVTLGVSGGWSFADNDWFQGPGFNGPVGFGTATARPVFGANLNLLRMGFAL